jgi:hypothetical protein
VRPIAEYRSLARKLCEFACDGYNGRPESDPVYQDVTEGRDVGAMMRAYSSCGDLPHWMFFRLGVRSPWVNRAEHAGWTMGGNIWKMEHTPATRVPGPRDVFACGDVLRIGDNGKEHVLVVIDHVDSIVHSADYGQPGCEFRSRTITERNGRPHLGGRIVSKHVDLARVISTADARGELVEPDLACLTAPTLASEQPTLKLGSSGRHVSELQRALRIRVDGSFGMVTLGALIRFQSAHGLTADGVCGPKTWAALTRP